MLSPMSWINFIPCPIPRREYCTVLKTFVGNYAQHDASLLQFYLLGCIFPAASFLIDSCLFDKSIRSRPASYNPVPLPTPQIAGLVRKLGHLTRKQRKHLRSTPDFRRRLHLLIPSRPPPPCFLFRRPPPPWETELKDRLTPMGLIFVRGLLELSPRLRFSVRQAMDHPWLADARDAVERKPRGGGYGRGRGSRGSEVVVMTSSADRKRGETYSGRQVN